MTAAPPAIRAIPYLLCPCGDSRPRLSGGAKLRIADTTSLNSPSRSGVTDAKTRSTPGPLSFAAQWALRRIATLAARLRLRSAALGGVPQHSFAAAIREVHHVPRGGGVVSHLRGLIARLPGANGLDEVRQMEYGRVRLIRKFQILRRWLNSRSLRFHSVISLIQECVLHRFWPAVDRVLVALALVLSLLDQPRAQQNGE